MGGLSALTGTAVDLFAVFLLLPATANTENSATKLSSILEIKRHLLLHLLRSAAQSAKRVIFRNEWQLTSKSACHNGWYAFSTPFID